MTRGHPRRGARRPTSSIVGTGAAGAMLAYELAARGREVLMLERGAHVDPRDFTENEADQLVRALPRRRAHAVEGLPLPGRPGHVRRRQHGGQQRRLLRPARRACATAGTTSSSAGLDADAPGRRLPLRARLPADRAARPARGPQPGREHLVEALEGHEEPPFDARPSSSATSPTASARGYCNIGCAYGKKLSALDWTLPEAQREFPRRGAHPAGLPRATRCSCAATRNGVRRATRRTAAGSPCARGTVVLSAGALASSVILQRSGLGDGPRRPRARRSTSPRR